MVMHVEVHHDSSFLSVDPDVNVILIDDRDSSGSSSTHRWMMSSDRDTSNTCRDTSMDNTRQTVNTQTSILDLTKDEETEDEDDDDDDGSVLYPDLHDTNPSRLLDDSLEEEETEGRAFSKASSRGNILAKFSPDHFFDTLCSSSSSNSGGRTGCAAVSCTPPASACIPAHYCGGGSNSKSDSNAATGPTKDYRSHSLSCVAPELRLQLETDVWTLLGCASPPDGLEMESIWNLSSIGKRKRRCRHAPKEVRPSRPSRASLKDRMHRIHRLRQERWSGVSRHGVTFSPFVRHSETVTGNARWDGTLKQRAVSMDQDDPVHNSSAVWMETQIGGPGMDSVQSGYGKENLHPSPLVDGYDSDPEFGPNHRATTTQLMVSQHTMVSDDSSLDDASSDSSSSPSSESVENEENVGEQQDHIVYQSVQQTLNSTWTLTWHPNPQNLKDFSLSGNKPLCVNLWMERGTVIPHSGVVVEPTFMWRDAYQPLLQHRKLNATSQKPWSMRLLNTCRIARCHPSTLDKAVYPLARPSHCLMLKTCQGQEFVLEANSESQIASIAERWKLAVARFASLAVTEDIDSIAAEFFHPTLSSQTLTLPTPMK